ncbi:MAG: aminoacyl-tRNA deacylase [Isosphaeraceae bacterium]
MNIRDYLLSERVTFEWFLHRPASTASRLARNVHVTGRAVAKAVLLWTGDGYCLAVLPATGRVDLERFSRLLAGSVVRLADEEEVSARLKDCERGAVPPFGRAFGLPTFVDLSLARGASKFVCVGNQRHEGLRLSYEDFERLERPRVAEFIEDHGTPPLSDTRRIAS